LGARREALSICSVRVAAAGIIDAVDSKVGHPQIAGAHHMGLSVRDLDRSIRFYCDVLGAALFREPYDGNSPSFSGRMAIVGLGALGLDLIEHASNGGEQFQPGRTGLDHLSFPTESLDDLRDWATWLDACDVSHSGVRDVPDVGSMLFFADPDGIALEFLFLDLEKLSQGAFAPG
jgi:glyoxylase I family protein